MKHQHGSNPQRKQGSRLQVQGQPGSPKNHWLLNALAIGVAGLRFRCRGGGLNRLAGKFNTAFGSCSRPGSDGSIPILRDSRACGIRYFWQKKCACHNEQNENTIAFLHRTTPFPIDNHDAIISGTPTHPYQGKGATPHSTTNRTLAATR